MGPPAPSPAPLGTPSTFQSWRWHRGLLPEEESKAGCWASPCRAPRPTGAAVRGDPAPCHPPTSPSPCATGGAAPVSPIPPAGLTPAHALFRALRELLLPSSGRARGFPAAKNTPIAKSGPPSHIFSDSWPSTPCGSGSCCCSCPTWCCEELTKRHIYGVLWGAERAVGPGRTPP